MTEVKIVTIEDVMEEKGQPSLKALAMIHGLNPVRLYAVAKTPKEGVLYDPKVYNWDAVGKFIARRFDEGEGKFQSFEQVIDAALAADAELQLQDGRKSRGSKVEKIELGDRTIPVRKWPSFEMEAGLNIVMRDDPQVYKIVYQTISHTVLVPVDAEGNVATSEVIVKSNGMLNFKGIPPTELEKAIAERYAPKA